MPTIVITINVILIVAGICVLLLKLNTNGKNKSARQLLSRFREFEKDQKLFFIDHEIFENVAIGFDEVQEKLVIVKMIKEHMYDHTVINLADVRSCEKREIYKRMSLDDNKVLKGVMQLESIILQLDLNNNVKSIVIPFYQIGTNTIFEIAKMRQRVSHWEKLLVGIIRDRSKMRA